MILSQFIDALDRHGSDLDHWPPDTRNAARDLLAQSPAAAAELAHARQVEQFMRAHDPAAALGADAVIRVSNAVMAALPARAQTPPSRWEKLLRGLGLRGLAIEWVPRFAMSVGTAALLGVLVGAKLPDYSASQTYSSDLLAMSESYLPLDLR